MKISRKQALKTMAAGTLRSMAIPSSSAALKNIPTLALAGNINHSVCQWCYGNIPLEQLCEAAKGMGLKSVELLGPKDWPVAIRYGLTCAMSNGSSLGIPRGFNDPAHHAQLLKDFSDVIRSEEHTSELQSRENLVCR